MRKLALSSRRICAWAPVENVLGPLFGVGMYCSRCWAGDDQARCGITAFGKTHCVDEYAAGEVIWLARGHAVAQLLLELTGEVTGPPTVPVSELA